MTQIATNDARFCMAQEWLAGLPASYGILPHTAVQASSDAGFRRYLRVSTAEGGTYIVMDAPPEKEDTRPFIAVDALMQAAGVRVPVIYEKDIGRGFLLLSDLGRQTYLDVLNEENARTLFDGATDALVKWQAASREGVLPLYDRAVLSRELDLFPEWYVKTHRGFQMTDQQRRIVQATFDKVMARNLGEARVFVHRDFMPRNLMVTPGMQDPGVLDFQDALYGPVSYDIASLMRDAFISWGEEFVIDQSIRYWEKARRAGIPVPRDFGVFWQDIEWMGFQRHLKVLGIFARLNYRDGKPRYLADTPRFLHYVRQTANRYDELKPVNWLLDMFEEVKTREEVTF